MKREKSIYKTTNMILIPFASNVYTRSGSQSVYFHECLCQVLVYNPKRTKLIQHSYFVNYLPALNYSHIQIANSCVFK